MRNQIIIKKMISYIDTVLKYTSNLNYVDFKNNTMMAEACIFNLSQIGELVNKLDENFLESFAEMPWFKMRGLRNRIVHDYEGINLKLVWEIIEDDLEGLKSQLIDLTN